MKEKSILFNTEMINAILVGNKTQTRRVIKPQPQKNMEIVCCDGLKRHMWTNGFYWNRYCPYGQSGDKLWVRETWYTEKKYDNIKPSLLPKNAIIWYVADCPNAREHTESGKTRSSIHMPKWASRITLEITNVTIEHVQEISEEDAKAEGITNSDIYKAVCHLNFPLPVSPYIGGFAYLWDSINAKKGYGWYKNPWVWVVEFKVLKGKNELF